MSRLGPTGRLSALVLACVLVFALAGSGVGTDARLGDSEVANVPVVVFGAAPNDDSDLVGTPLTLTFEGLTSETDDWPDGFDAVADDTATASFSVATTDSTESTGESNETTETTEAPVDPEYVVSVDSVGSDSVRFTLAGGEQTPATVAVDGDLLARALGLSAFDPGSVELRIDGTVTGYDTTASGTVQFHTTDWADRTVAFRAVEDGAPVTETPTAPEETPNGTTEAPSDETPTETTTEETPTETPTEKTPTETPTETSTEETPTEAPTEETPTETPTETSTEETPTEAPTEETPTETPTEETPTETPTEHSTEATPTETSSDETETESPESTETTAPESSATETADAEPSQTPDEAGE